MRIMKTHWKTGLLGIVAAALLSACASPSVQHATQPSNSIQTAARSERLGTGWGDEVDSRVSRVHLRRTSATPIDETAIRYANKAYQGRSINSIALAAGKIELAVRSDRRALQPASVSWRSSDSLSTRIPMELSSMAWSSSGL